MQRNPTAPEFALAAQHDAAGRHDEAINALARGTRAGDPACTTLLADACWSEIVRRCSRPKARAFLHDAAQQGGGEAAARIAALTALGLYCKQSWQDAVRWLIVSAERDWQPAQAQLARAGPASALGSQ